MKGPSHAEVSFPPGDWTFFVMITTKLLLVLGVLEGCHETVLLGRVEIGSPSCFGLALVVVLGVRSTKGDIRMEDGLRTVDHEEGGVAGGPTSLRTQPPYYFG